MAENNAQQVNGVTPGFFYPHEKITGFVRRYPEINSRSVQVAQSTEVEQVTEAHRHLTTDESPYREDRGFPGGSSKGRQLDENLPERG